MSSNILAQTAVITVVAMGQHLVILTRGIDLSVGSNLALGVRGSGRCCSTPAVRLPPLSSWR